MTALPLATGAQPAAERIPDIRQYVGAMRSTLADAGVKITRLESPGDRLLIDYEVTGENLHPEFALGAVLRLAQPIAGAARTVSVRLMRGRDRLMELSLRPEEIDGVVTASTGEAQREEIERLREAVLLECGARVPSVPIAETAPATSTPATIRQLGDVPVGGPELPALLTQHTTRPGAATAVVITEGSGMKPEPIPEADGPKLADDLRQRLTEDDLENIEIARVGDGAWIIGFENRTQRSDIDAIAVALATTASVLPPADVILEVKRHDVTVSHVRVALADYVKLQAGMLSAEKLSATWSVDAGPPDVTEPVEVLARGNESFFRTDLLLRPGLDYTIGLEHDPFVGDFFLLMDARTTLAPGLWANARFPARLTADPQVTMDQALLSWVGRPIDGVLATGSGGKFRDDLHGFYGEVRTDTREHQFGIVGSVTNRASSLDPSDGCRRSFAYYQHDWGRLALKTRLGYGRFIESGEEGLALSLDRRFGESEIGLRAIRTDDGDEGLVFKLSVPLGPKRASSPAAVRPRLAPALTFDYTSNFAALGDYLQGPFDLNSFRGELSPAYLQQHGERLTGGIRSRVSEIWRTAPSFEGTSGLMRIPTADVAPDGRVFTGISYFDREHSKVQSADTNAMPTFVGIGFLPNLEIVGRLTFFHDVRAFSWNYNLDRSFNLHYRLNEQRGNWFPAFAVGAQDVGFGTSTSYLGDAEYLVATLRRDNLRAHVGIGNGKFSPAFGGLDMALGGDNPFHLMIEHDSNYFNAGVRGFIGDCCTASVGLLGLEGLTGSVTFRTELQ